MTDPTEPRGGEGRAKERRDSKYWRDAYEELVRQTGRDLNDGCGLCKCRAHPSPLYRPPVVHGWPDRASVEIALASQRGVRDCIARGHISIIDLSSAVLSLFPPVVGWRMVPVEPTPEMVKAAGNAPFSDKRNATTNIYDRRMETIADILRAGIAASPLTDGVGEKR